MSLAAMKQALAALENSQSYVDYVEFDWVQNQCGRAITALRAAIEQAHGDWDEVEALRASLREHMAEIQRLRDAIEQEPVAWVYPEGLEALKIGRPWTAYGSSGEGRIPLYLNDAVARRAEPRLGGSGAGFESLPASPQTTWWDDPVSKMQREWKGLTDEELNQIYAEPQTHAGQYARAIEARLKEKNHG